MTQHIFPGCIFTRVNYPSPPLDDLLPLYVPVYVHYVHRLLVHIKGFYDVMCNRMLTGIGMAPASEDAKMRPYNVRLLFSIQVLPRPGPGPSL